MSEDSSNNQQRDISSGAEANYLKGAPLSVDELEYMDSNLEAAAPRKAVIACGALLRDRSSSSDQKQRARDTLKRVMSEAKAHDVRLELSVMFLLVPISELQHKFVAMFLDELMEAEIFTERVNALAVLERLAKAGDNSALAGIRRALHDKNEVVRNGASNILRSLSKQ